MLLLKVFDDFVHEIVIDFAPSKSLVTLKAQNFDHSVTDFNKCDIECASAEIENKNVLTIKVAVSHQACSICRCIRLSDQSDALKPSKLTSLLGRFLLCRVEVCRHCDHGSSDREPCVDFNDSFSLFQHFCRDLLRRDSFNACPFKLDVDAIILSLLDTERPLATELNNVLVLDLCADHTLCIEDPVWRSLRRHPYQVLLWPERHP